MGKPYRLLHPEPAPSRERGSPDRPPAVNGGDGSDIRDVRRRTQPPADVRGRPHSQSGAEPNPLPRRPIKYSVGREPLKARWGRCGMWGFQWLLPMCWPMHACRGYGIHVGCRPSGSNYDPPNPSSGFYPRHVDGSLKLPHIDGCINPYRQLSR